MHVAPSHLEALAAISENFPQVHIQATVFANRLHVVMEAGHVATFATVPANLGELKMAGVLGGMARDATK